MSLQTIIRKFLVITGVFLCIAIVCSGYLSAVPGKRAARTRHAKSPASALSASVQGAAGKGSSSGSTSELELAYEQLTSMFFQRLSSDISLRISDKGVGWSIEW